MKKTTKVFVVVLDGVSLRNFVYTDFPTIARTKDIEVTFWNATPHDFSAEGHREIRFDHNPTHPFSQPLKIAKNRVEINMNKILDGDDIYENYFFALKSRNLSSFAKNAAARLISIFSNSTTGARRLTARLYTTERKTLHYRNLRNTLERERPDFVFFTNQRHLAAIAAVAAAKDLDIPTGTFIFSWDNLPKAMLLVEADYYFVWSDYMKMELMKYYPFIKEDRIKVTGTPQFEPHNDASLIVPRLEFCSRFGLDPYKKYICFSGDDSTTSPFDATYLRDTAKAVRQLNKEGENIGILFRRCPVDFSARFDSVIDKFDEITSIDPDWRTTSSDWSSIIPNKSDVGLLINTIEHSEMVINLGSSMVFDFVSFNKPCAYVGYEPLDKTDSAWSVETIYKLIHFKSMTSKNAVVWLDSPEVIGKKISAVLQDIESSVPEGKLWFEKIVLHPMTLASERIWSEIDKIVHSRTS